MDINLHIGAHRSATTTLQQFLERNRPTLRRSGIEVWTPERTRAGLFAGLIERPEDLTEQMKRRGVRSCGVIAIEVQVLARAGQTQLLISEENLIGSVRNNLRQARLYPAAADRLQRFAGCFGAGPRRIGLSIRSYDSFWASSIAFGLGQGLRMPLGPALDHYVTQSRRWRDLIIEVAAVFPRAEIIVWPFERLAGQPERQLALLTGNRPLILPLTGARERTNISPHCGELRQIVAARGDAARGDAALCQTLQDSRDGRWMPFDPAQRAALRAQYDADLHWLRQGADGLARLIDPAGAVGSDGRGSAADDWAAQEALTALETGPDGRMPEGRISGPVMTTKGCDFGRDGATGQGAVA